MFSILLPSKVKLAARAHPHGCVLVTDGIAALGLGDGLHGLGDVPVAVAGGRATLAADGTTLAGAVRTQGGGRGGALPHPCTIKAKACF